MQLRELLKYSTNQLNSAGLDASTLEAGAILCHVLNIDRAYLYAHPEENVETEAENCILDLIDKRVRRIPLQQLLGFQEFMSLNFKVNKNVLIPRQDTEILVETVIDYCKSIQGEIRILELGTGSGCISVSLAKYIQEASITAVDISEEALKMAEENAVLNGVRHKINFIEGDLFTEVKNNDFNIIVSNPPYIPTEDIKSLEPEVRDYEPMLALDGGNDGLDYYRKISEGAKNHLKVNGIIAFEVGIYQAEMVSDILRLNGFSEICLIKDLSLIERVVCGKLIPSKSL